MLALRKRCCQKPFLEPVFLMDCYKSLNTTYFEYKNPIIKLRAEKIIMVKTGYQFRVSATAPVRKLSEPINETNRK